MDVEPSNITVHVLYMHIRNIIYKLHVSITLHVHFRNGKKTLMNSSAGYSVKCLPNTLDEVQLTEGALSSLILTQN